MHTLVPLNVNQPRSSIPLILYVNVDEGGSAFGGRFSRLGLLPAASLPRREARKYDGFVYLTHCDNHSCVGGTIQEIAASLRF